MSGKLTLNVLVRSMFADALDASPNTVFVLLRKGIPYREESFSVLCTPRVHPLTRFPAVELPLSETVLPLCAQTHQAILGAIPEAFSCSARRRPLPGRQVLADNYDPAAQNDPMSNLRPIDLRRRSIKAGTIVRAAGFSCSLSTDHWKHPPPPPPPPLHPLGV